MHHVLTCAGPCQFCFLQIQIQKQKVVSLRHVLTHVSLVYVRPASCYVPTTFAAASVRLTMNWGLWNTVERPGDVACTSYALLCLAKIWHPVGFDQGIMTPFIELCTEWCQDDVDWNRRCLDISVWIIWSHTLIISKTIEILGRKFKIWFSDPSGLDPSQSWPTTTRSRWWWKHN